MPKRITYLEKRADLDRAAFRRHWTTTHADIARGLPGVCSYRQNHVQQVLVGPGIYRVDGIVELWFTDDQAAGAGYASDVANRLIEDEPRFLSGLTGAPVVAPAPPPATIGKVWVLACCDMQAEEATARDWVEATAAEVGAVYGQANLLVEDAELLVREALRSEPEIPQFAGAFGFEGLAAVQAAGPRIAELVAACEWLRRIQVLIADEVVIV